MVDQLCWSRIGSQMYPYVVMYRSCLLHRYHHVLPTCTAPSGDASGFWTHDPGWRPVGWLCDSLFGPFSHVIQLFWLFFTAHSLKLAIVLALLVLLIHLPSSSHHLLIIPGGAAGEVVRDPGSGTGGEGLWNMSLCLHLPIFRPLSTHHTGQDSWRSYSGSGLGNWWREWRDMSLDRKRTGRWNHMTCARCSR